MVAAGWGGFWLGQQKVNWTFEHWKPAVVINKQPDLTATSGRQTDFSQFWLVWDKLNQKYVDKSKLDSKKMVDGAISGMVAAVGDPYTVYLPFQQNKATKEDLGGAFEGVGMELGFSKDNQLIVVSPLEGSPAKAAGIKSGDFILRITDEKNKVDKTTEGIALPDAVSEIRGTKGTTVKLSLAREGVDKPFDVTLTRDTIVIKSVTLNWQNDNKVAWVKLMKFGERTQDEWNEAVTGIINQCGMDGKKCMGVVLDLRGNPGGYLEGAVYTAGEFLSAGKIVVTQQYGDGTKIDNAVQRNGRLLTIPVVVLVNKGSASAAEILSGALQDYKRVKIVGEQSFGKGSVQEPEDLGDGSGIHITVAKWLRPLGDWIDKKGITPDVVIKWDGSGAGLPKDDPQLQKAIEILSKV